MCSGLRLGVVQQGRLLFSGENGIETQSGRMTVLRLARGIPCPTLLAPGLLRKRGLR